MRSGTDIYEEYHGKVLSYIRSRVAHPQDAEDLCSAVFEKALLRQDTYDERKGSVSTWLYQITRNTVTDYYRTRRVWEEPDENLPGPDDADGALLKRETLSALADALERLPERERDILVLHYYGGYTLKEVSERMDVPYRTVKRAKQAALDRLRVLMKDHL